jgi:ubiquinone/menaquinone biosynthesis C-methylase UbiE
MGLLPPRGFLWSLRLRGYISYLCGMTNGECADITLLDQGFVQLICSLVLLSGIVDRRRILEALASVPKPDLVIRVDTPLELVEARLLERRQRLGPIQRRLELNLKTSFEQVKIVEMLSEMLASQGQRSMKIGCFDERSLTAATEKVLAEVRSMPVRPVDDAGTAEGPNDERQYQDRTFARRYLTAYAGPFRLKTLAAWMIATLERRHVARALKQCQPPPAVLLDVPCGTGKLAKVLATMETEVVGADLSTAMIELARGAYPTSRFHGFACGSAEQLPFRTAAFDTVVCLRLMHLVPPASRRNITKELARVTSRHVIVSFGVLTSFQLFRLKIRRAIVRGTSAPHPVRFADLQTEIEEAGLHITQWRRILPALSCEYLLTLEKVGAGRA